MVTRESADPRRLHPAQTQLDIRFSRQFKEWKDQDPAPRPEHALPNSTVRWLAQMYSNSLLKKLNIIADLVVVAYFFLLLYECVNTPNRRGSLTLFRYDARIYSSGGTTEYFLTPYLQTSYY